LLAWALLVPVVRSEDNPSWVGKRIILRGDGVRIGYTDDKGLPVHVADLTDLVYRVLGEENGWLRVRQCGVEGWFAKDSALLLEEAIPYFTDRLRNNSRDAVSFAHRGRAWQEKGDVERALQDYEDALRAATEVDSTPTGPLGLRRLLIRRVASYPPQASWYRGRGQIYQKKGDLDRALREFTQAMRQSPTDPLSYVDRGIVYKQLKDYDRALADHGEAVRLAPRWATAYFNRANVFKARKDYDKAIADYGEAIRLEPTDPDAYFNRASTYQATRQYARAAKDWREVIRLDAGDAGAHDRLAWLLATCPDENLRDGARAIEYAGIACDLVEGKSPDYQATLAAAFAEAGRFDLAVKWQRRALESPEYEREEGPAARQRLQLFEKRQPYRAE
jgi:tetratricopeptide (TPR) repeat protein